MNQSKYFFHLFVSVIFYFSSNNSNENLLIFQNKRILITGGTGYLGTALTNEILNYNPEQIIIFSRDEVKHFNFSKKFNSPKIKNIEGDVRDYNALLNNTKNIDLVIHSAALKRIDSIEENVEESIKTNIQGSINIFNACVRNKVKKVIFISTDKACSPINTYGACKFISEKIFTNYDRKNIKTEFSVVRYGNVLDSTGSVIPIFLENIEKNKDIFLTDARMTRFIIDKNEAIELIFDAIKYGVGGEIFVKYLPALKVIDLIEILKTKLNAKNNIKIIGIRPGEKLHESLINKYEIVRTYEFKNLFVITPSIPNWSTNFNENNIPIYIKFGHLVNNNDMKKFSSNNSLISKEELSEILKQKLNI